MHDTPMQTDKPNGVRSSDWLDAFIFRYVDLQRNPHHDK